MKSGWVILLTGLVACGDGPVAPNFGGLAVVMGGLPSGLSPSVTVTGPHGFNILLSSPDTLTVLRPGTYTIVPSEVTSEGVGYSATPQTQTIAVASGALATASEMGYAISTARLRCQGTGSAGWDSIERRTYRAERVLANSFDDRAE
jgi:hypothetical protein